MIAFVEAFVAAITTHLIAAFDNTMSNVKQSDSELSWRNVSSARLLLLGNKNYLVHNVLNKIEHCWRKVIWNIGLCLTYSWILYCFVDPLVVSLVIIKKVLNKKTTKYWSTVCVWDAYYKFRSINYVGVLLFTCSFLYNYVGITHWI